MRIRGEIFHRSLVPSSSVQQETPQHKYSAGRYLGAIPDADGYEAEVLSSLAWGPDGEPDRADAKAIVEQRRAAVDSTRRRYLERISRAATKAEARQYAAERKTNTQRTRRLLLETNEAQLGDWSTKRRRRRFANLRALQVS